MYHALIFSVHTMRPAYRRPPGAHRIASFLREHGWDVEVIDWVENWSLEELQELARSRITSRTVFCGFSTFFSAWTDHTETLATWLKQQYPDIKLVVGGQSKPRMTSKSIDYYVTGFGENALLALIQSFISNSSGKGITFDPKYFGNKKVITANHYYPSYPMKSLMIQYEDRDFIEPDEWLTVEFARGCIFKCLYCNFPVLGVKEDHTRDADDFYNQMKDTYDRFGVTNYFVSDETFNDYSEKIIKFADAADRLTFEPFFSGFIRGDLLVSRPQDWEHLSRLGFLGHFYGIESMNHKTAKAIGKGMHPEKLREGLLKAKDYFKTHDRKLYRGNIALMVGLPFETENSMKESLDWIVKNWQGESAEVWPLEIPLSYQEDVLSGLSLDYKKWGYRESSIEPYVFDDDEVAKQAEVKHGISNLNWENDHWNFRRCQEISADWARNYGNFDFRLGPFGLNMLGDEKSKIEDLLALNVKNISIKVQEEKRIKNYIRKKLSL